MPHPLITIITATTGSPLLERCLKSVQSQTQTSISHCVVIDGPEHSPRARTIINAIPHSNIPIQTLELPEPTGKNDWICHRIYGALPYLVNSDWVCFLDEDNFFDPDHLSSLFSAVTAHQALWSFSLRKICDDAGNLLCLDQCESLGSLHPVFGTTDVHLVDTNCYFLRRDLAIAFCAVWNRPRNPQDMHKPDFELCMSLLKHNFQPAPTRRHTLNYTVAKQPTSMPATFFLERNALMRQQYPNGLPWEKPPMEPRT